MTATNYSDYTDYTNGNIKQHTVLTLHVDGACKPRNPGGITTSAWILYDQKDTLLVQEGRVVKDGGSESTCNYGEYCALGFALRWLLDQDWKGSLKIQSDSKLLVNQVLNNWKCNFEHLKKLRIRIWEIMAQLGLQRLNNKNGVISGPDGDIDPSLARPISINAYFLQWVPRTQNAAADALCHKTYIRYQTWKQQKKSNPP